MKEATEFYVDQLSDDTMISSFTNDKGELDPSTWKTIKSKVMGVNNYEEQQWFDKLSDYDKDLIRSLKSAQE